jgi:hypothetical protein
MRSWISELSDRRYPPIPYSPLYSVPRISIPVSLWEIQRYEAWDSPLCDSFDFFFRDHTHPMGNAPCGMGNRGQVTLTS